MTHPTQPCHGPLPLADALARLDARDKTNICLTVNMYVGNAQAKALLDLWNAAENEVRARRDEQDAAKELAFRRAVSS